MPNKYTLEICANSYASALVAKEGGAQRVELCYALAEGGLTPSHAELKRVCQNIDIKVNVLIRPRGGDFLYSTDEYEIIKEDVLYAKEIGANAVVIGFLTSDGRVDVERTREIVELAKPLTVTFHRAFDMCRNLEQALEDVIASGCDKILTSGGKSKAIDAVGNLKMLIEKAANRIVIMPGAGVDTSNIAELVKQTGAVEFHSSAKCKVQSKMIFKNTDAYMGTADVDEYSYVQSDVEQVKKMVNVLKSLD